MNHSNSLLENPNGFNALDFAGERIVSDDLIKAEEILKLNYGIDYPIEKFTILWEMIMEEKWTKQRLMATVKWFLKTKRYPNWTIADWFDYQVKLYPHSWYIKQINEGVKSSEIECYKINGKAYFKLIDGITLPFEKVN